MCYTFKGHLDGYNVKLPSSDVDLNLSGTLHIRYSRDIWAVWDLNPGPHDYESRALTS